MHFTIQIILVVVLGNFLGELHRSSILNNNIDRRFVSNFLLGSFLSFFLAKAFYLIVEIQTLTLIFTGMIAVKDESWIGDTCDKILNELINSEKSRK